MVIQKPHGQELDCFFASASRNDGSASGVAMGAPVSYRRKQKAVWGQEMLTRILQAAAIRAWLAVCLVLASQAYDQDEYVCDRREFRRLCASR